MSRPYAIPIIDRVSERLADPPFGVLGAGCWCKPDDPGANLVWRLGLRLVFDFSGLTGRAGPGGIRPARRLIYRDFVGPTLADAIDRIGAWFAGGHAIARIELWTAERVRGGGAIETPMDHG